MIRSGLGQDETVENLGRYADRIPQGSQMFQREVDVVRCERAQVKLLKRGNGGRRSRLAAEDLTESRARGGGSDDPSAAKVAFSDLLADFPDVVSWEIQAQDIR